MTTEDTTREALATRGAVVWIDRVDGRSMLVVIAKPIDARGITVVHLAGDTPLQKVTWSSVVAARLANVERWSHFSAIVEMQKRGEFMRHDRKKGASCRR